MGKGLLSLFRSKSGSSNKGVAPPKQRDVLDAAELRDPLEANEDTVEDGASEGSEQTGLGLSSLVDIAEASGDPSPSPEGEPDAPAPKKKRALGKRLKDLFKPGEKSDEDTTGMGSKLGLSSHAAQMKSSLGKALSDEGDGPEAVKAADKLAGIGGGLGGVLEQVVDGGEAVLKAETTSGKLGALSKGSGASAKGIGGLVGDTASALGNDAVGKYSGAVGGAAEKLGGIGDKGAKLYDVLKDKKASKGKKARAALGFGFEGTQGLGEAGDLVRGAIEGGDDTEAGVGFSAVNTVTSSLGATTTMLNKDAEKSDRIKAVGTLAGNTKKGISITSDALKHANKVSESEALKSYTGGVGAGLDAVGSGANFLGTLYDKKATTKDKLKAGGKAAASLGTTAIAVASDVNKVVGNEGAGGIIGKIGESYNGLTGGVGAGFGLGGHLKDTYKGIKERDLEKVTKNGFASAGDVSSLVKHGASIAQPFLSGGAATTAASVASTADIVTGVITGGASAALNGVGASKDFLHATKLSNKLGAGKATRGLLQDTERALAEQWGIDTEDSKWETAFHKRFAKEDEASWASEEARDRFEGDPLVKRYLDAAKLDKNRKFLRNQQVKAGVAKSVDGVGDVLNLAGTFTAEADFGATKIAGIALKTGVMGARVAQKASDRAEQTSAAVDLSDTLKGYNKQGVIGKGLTKVKEHTYDPVAKAAKSAGGWVKDNAVDPAAAALREHVIDPVAAAGREAGSKIKGAGKFLGGKIKGAGKFLGGKVKQAGKYLGGKAKDAAGWTKDHVLDPAGAKAQEAAGWTKDHVLDPMGAKAQEAAGWTKDHVLDPVGEGAKKAGNYVGGKLKGAAGWTKDHVLDPAERGLAYAGGKMGEAASWAKDKAGEAGDWMKNTGREGGAWLQEHVADPLGRGASAAGKYVGGKAQDAASWTKDHVLDPVGEKAKAAGTYVGGKAQDAASWTKSKVLDPVGEKAKAAGTYVGGKAQDAASWTKSKVLDPVGEKAKAAGTYVGGKAQDAASWTKDHVLDPVGEKAKAAGTYVGGKARDAASWTKDRVLGPVSDKARAAAAWTEEKVIDPVSKAANKHVIDPTKKAAKWTKENVWETSDMKWARKAGAFLTPQGSDAMLADAREKMADNKDNEHLTKLRESDYKSYRKLEERLEGNKKNRAVGHLTKMAASDDEDFAKASKKVIKAVGVNPDKEGADKKLRAKMDF